MANATDNTSPLLSADSDVLMSGHPYAFFKGTIASTDGSTLAVSDNGNETEIKYEYVATKEG